MSDVSARAILTKVFCCSRRLLRNRNFSLLLKVCWEGIIGRRLESIGSFTAAKHFLYGTNIIAGASSFDKNFGTGAPWKIEIFLALELSAKALA